MSIAYESVQKELIKLVVAGSLKVGDRLPSEVEMARELGVSRPVVREALGGLRAMGLVDSRRGRGTFVAATRASAFNGRHTLAETFEARTELASVEGRLAARRMSAEDNAEIRRLLRAMETTTDAKAWAELDWSFHTALARATGNEILVEISEQLRASVNYMSMAIWGAARNQVALEEHQRIYAALKQRDERKTVRAMVAHVRAVHQEIVRIYGTEGIPGPQGSRVMVTEEAEGNDQLPQDP